jgi:periplasmic protein TonB
MSRVEPHYPEEAKEARIQGRVVLQAEISKDGIVQNLQLVSGDPVLAQAAIDAVKKWKYKPYPDTFGNYSQTLTQPRVMELSAIYQF